MSVVEKIERIEELLKSLKEEIFQINVPEILDTEEFRAFLREPYLILPKGKDEYYVIVPRFIDFHVGWLEMQTDSYNVFVINRFTQWFSPLPDELRRKIKLHEMPEAYVDGKYLKTTKEHRDELWKRYRQFLARREGDDVIRIKRGYEFELIAALIDDGILPFKPQPVSEEDLRDWDGIELRDYQRKAWEEFLEKGSIGIFWPPGVGKSYFGLYALARVKGRKLVVVPTRTLVEQWTKMIRGTIIEYAHEITVVTYHSFKKVAGKEYTLVIFDEVHHLPAPSFIRLSTLKRKYTIGLSASPYREDGRESYILALTGFPVGLDWEKFVKEGLIRKPEFKVKVVKNEAAKLKLLDKLLKENKKTLIFCDYIEFGRKIANRYGLPFVYSRTKRRLDMLKDEKLVVVSRVGDEGVSLPNIERVIEVAFLGRSRRQQVQRFGRLLHSPKSVEHVLIMTEDEFERFYSRVYAIEEKGFRVVVERER